MANSSHNNLHVIQYKIHSRKTQQGHKQFMHGLASMQCLYAALSKYTQAFQCAIALCNYDSRVGRQKLFKLNYSVLFTSYQCMEP